MPLSNTAGLKLAPPAFIQGSSAPEELEELDELEDDELEDELDEELLDELLEDELLARPELLEELELELMRPDEELDEELDELELEEAPSTSGPLQAVETSAARSAAPKTCIRLIKALL